MSLRGLSIYCKLYLALIVFSLAGTVYVHLTKANPGIVAPMASLLTLLFGVIAITAPFFPRGLGFAVMGVFFLGLVVERVGVGTGYPFGRYFYTDVWWPTAKLTNGNDFPILVPFAWGLVTLGAYAVAVRFTPLRNRILLALLVGLIAALVDLAMEPVMTGVLHYWIWLQHGPLPGGVPWMNFFGWWGTAFLGALMLNPKSGREVDTREPVIVLVGHLVLIAGIAAASVKY